MQGYDIHDAMRSLIWHKDQNSVLLYGPLSMRPRQHDRFVLIGLCWLYGRSEFPPRPPLWGKCAYVDVARLASWHCSLHCSGQVDSSPSQ